MFSEHTDWPEVEIQGRQYVMPYYLKQICAFHGFID